MLLHFEEMDELGHSAALLHNILQVHVGVSNELVDCLQISKDTVLFVVLEDSKVWFTWHEEAMLYDIDQTETEEVQWDVHELWCRVRHQSQDILGLSSHLTVNIGCNLFLLEAETLSLLSVESLTLTDGSLSQSVSHVLLILDQHLEELSSQDSEILLFQELRIDLR